MGSSGTGDLVLRRGAADDADIAAALHAGQIAEGFLSFLGAPFLARLYRRIIGAQHTQWIACGHATPPSG